MKQFPVCVGKIDGLWVSPSQPFNYNTLIELHFVREEVSFYQSVAVFLLKIYSCCAFFIQLPVLKTHCWRPHPLSLCHPTPLTHHTEWYTSHKTTHHHLTVTLPTSHPHHLPPSPSQTLLLPHSHLMILHTPHLLHPHIITLPIPNPHTITHPTHHQTSLHTFHPSHTITHHTLLPTLSNITPTQLPIITTPINTPTLPLQEDLEVKVRYKLCAGHHQ